MTYDAITSMPAGQELSANHQPVHAAIKANLEEVQSGLGVVSNTPGAYKYLVSRSSGTSLWLERPQFDVRDFGAVAYSSRAAALAGSSSTSAIDAAITACDAAGGGEVFAPAGFYKITSSGVYPISKSNVHIRGAGIGATYLVAASGLNGSVVAFNDCTDCSVSHMTIDGNSDNQTAGHGVAGEGGGSTTNTRLHIHDLHIKDCRAYGIGLQNGTFDGARIHHVWTEDTGADGIDCKNKNSDNTPIFIHDVDVLRPIRRDAADQSAIGVRGGPVIMRNISIRGMAGAVGSQPIGIAFELGEAEDEGTPNGLGAHGSSLDGFVIDCTGMADSVGINNSARDVSVSNGIIYGADIGVLAQGSGERMRVTNVIADGSLDYAFYGQHEDVSFVNCTAVNGTTDGGGTGGGFYASQRTTISGCLIKDNDGPGLTFQAASSATDSKIIGNTFDGNGSTVTTNNIVALFRDNTGYVTEAWGSAVISGGTVTVSHGLAGTPQHVAPERGSGADITYSATSTELTFTGVDGTIRWYARYQP